MKYSLFQKEEILPNSSYEVSITLFVIKTIQSLHEKGKVHGNNKGMQLSREPKDSLKQIMQLSKIV